MDVACPVEHHWTLGDRGRVKSVEVAPGATVEKGTLLVALE